MTDYKTLYFKLFRAQNQAIDILIQAGREAEEIVLNSADRLGLLQTVSEKEQSEAESEE